ncbi:MAG: hypothetical protein K8R37_01310 [Bacteroidales bacterium]|nr:hypothetical protein [Bacteroidales bacterium]
MNNKLNYISIIIFLLLVSCLRPEDHQEKHQSFHSVHCMDTNMVWIHPVDDNDTLFRLRAVEFSGNGKLEDGVWSIYYDQEFKKKASELTIKNNKKNGPYAYWRRNGNKWFEGVEINGLSQGTYRSWYKNGQLKYNAEYLDDKLFGISQEWYETGELQMETEYLIGQKNRQTYFYKNGNKSWEEYYNSKPSSNKKYELIRLLFDSTGMFEEALRYDRDTVWNEESQAYYVYLVPTNIDSLEIK